MSRLFVVCVLFLATGCMAPCQKKEDTDTTLDPVPASVEQSITVSTSTDAMVSIHSWLGDKNAVTLENALTVEQQGVRIDLQAGGRLEYELNDDGGRFLFTPPKPIVHVEAAGIPLSLPLNQVLLKSDGTGVATVQVGPFTKNRGFRWLDDGGDVAAAVERKLPKVYCYDTEGCAPCERAKREFAADKAELPFEPEWRKDPPEWAESGRPFFWWHISEDVPTQKDVQNTRQKVGYTTLSEFKKTWAATRVKK